MEISTNAIYILIAIIVVAVLLIFIILNRKSSNTTIKNKSNVVDMEQLIKALGNKENIKDVSSTMSKVTFVLSDYKKVDIEIIKSLGASGIVENNRGLNVIFGKISPTIEEMMKEIL